MKITFEYFCDEYHRFRKILGSTEYDVNHKLKAWEGLLFVYVSIEDMTAEQTDIAKTTMVSTVNEINDRIGLAVLAAALM